MGYPGRMTFLLYVDRETSDFILQRDGQMGSERFPNLRAAIRHAENQRGNSGARLLVHNEEGKRVMELDL